VSPIPMVRSSLCPLSEMNVVLPYYIISHPIIKSNPLFLEIARISFLGQQANRIGCLGVTTQAS
jgi:hypothetical protein